MESFIHLRMGTTPTDKEIYEIAGANHYYSGPDQRGKLREAAGIATDWLDRHELAVAP